MQWHGHDGHVARSDFSALLSSGRIGCLGVTTPTSSLFLFSFCRTLLGVCLFIKFGSEGTLAGFLAARIKPVTHATSKSFLFIFWARALSRFFSTKFDFVALVLRSISFYGNPARGGVTDPITSHKSTGAPAATPYLAVNRILSAWLMLPFDGR
jgi:hypothetical protein